VTASLSRRAASEVLGTAFLLAVVVGSATLAERLSGCLVGAMFTPREATS
jgi:hypothetical protein